METEKPVQRGIVITQETTADDNIQLPVRNRLQQATDIGRIMLAISIQEHEGVERPVFACPLQRRLDGGAFAAVLTVLQDYGTGAPSGFSAAVGGSIVHDENLVDKSSRLANDSRDCALLVQDGDGRCGAHHWIDGCGFGRRPLVGDPTLNG